MTESEFLTLLATSLQGKLVCLNLDRARVASLVDDGLVRDFLTQCAADCTNELPKHPADEPFTIALAVAKHWGSREQASRSGRRVVDKRDVDGAGVATVAHLWSVVREFSEETGSTYFDRRTKSSDDFSELVRMLVNCDRSWHFGRNRDYCWVASVLDASTKASTRSGSVAQLQRDLLGLCHFGDNDVLIRLAIPGRPMALVSSFYRPMPFDGLDNPAFRATCDEETPVLQHPYGMTVDLYKLGKRQPEVNGTREWLCAPTSVPACDLTWDFLGTPNSKVATNDPEMNKRMYRALGGRPALKLALTGLKTLVGGCVA